MNRDVIRACLLAILLVLAVRGDSQGNEKAHLKEEVRLAALSGTLEQVAAAFADSDLSVGLVLDAAEHLSSEPRRRGASKKPEKSEDLLRVQGALRQRFPDYQVKMNASHGGIVRIEPRNGGVCGAILKMQVPRVTLEAAAADVVQRTQLLARGEPMPTSPLGFIGRGGSEDEQNARARLASRVAVNVDGEDLGQVLDLIVKQVAGLGWALRQLPLDPENPGLPQCALSLFSGGGWMSPIAHIPVPPEQD